LNGCATAPLRHRAIGAPKLSHFAAQARVTDAADMADLGMRKQLVLIARLLGSV
jgi:hypothetical protein